MQHFKMRNVKYAAASLFLIGGVLVLTGCGSGIRVGSDMKNVEERDYATIMLVEEREDTRFHFVLGMAQEKVMGEKSMVEEVREWDAENLVELAKDYGNVTGKDLSLSHLKVILIGGQETKTDSQSVQEKEAQNGKTVNAGVTKKEESLLHDQFQREAWMEQLLYMLKDEDEIAKTCPVLELKEPQEFTDFLEEEEEPVGNYLENLVRVKEQRGEDVPWLKDYLKALQEQEEIKVMYLEKAEEGWEIVKEN